MPGRRLLGVKVRAKIRPKADPDAEAREITAEAPDYASAVAELDAQTPEGWIRLYVMTVRD